ncbi:unnamed protein product [Prorocentrum cordatum]|uniref:Uncharacterized protein n=1 Tax=Prorocentrum cordatum TaxID=2364126 RepID=A0ABN9SH62_9DINO|nr:unnamed protein product [Polarella glacialis]
MGRGRTMMPDAAVLMSPKRACSEACGVGLRRASRQDANRIASVGHDGNMCILDPRSPKMPMTSVRLGRTGSVPTKLLSLAWLGRDGLAVGGSDGKVVQVGLRAGEAAPAGAGA